MPDPFKMPLTKHLKMEAPRITGLFWEILINNFASSAFTRLRTSIQYILVRGSQMQAPNLGQKMTCSVGKITPQEIPYYSAMQLERKMQGVCAGINFVAVLVWEKRDVQSSWVRGYYLLFDQLNSIKKIPFSASFRECVRAFAGCISRKQGDLGIGDMLLWCIGSAQAGLPTLIWMHGAWHACLLLMLMEGTELSPLHCDENRHISIVAIQTCE